LCRCSWQLNETHHYQYYIEDGFTIDQQGIIINSFLEWEYLTDKTVSFEPVIIPEGQHLIHIYPGTIKTLDHRAGLTTPYYETIKLATDQINENFRKTALHEVGHSIGLSHTGQGTIMCATLGCTNLDITCADLEQFCEVWRCDPTPLCKRLVENTAQ